jgi:hypothetical protein
LRSRLRLYLAGFIQAYLVPGGEFSDRAVVVALLIGGLAFLAAGVVLRS